MKTPILFRPLAHNLKPTVHQIKQIMWGRKASPPVKHGFRSHSEEKTAGYVLYIFFVKEGDKINHVKFVRVEHFL